MGHARDRVIDVRVSRSPTALERPLMAPYLQIGNRAKWIAVPRGPVSLQVEMPARRNVRSAIGLFVPTLALVAFIEFVLWRIDAGVSPWATLAILGVTLVSGAAIWLGVYAPFAARETLEIDSMLVTLRRGSRYLAAWSRATFDDMRLAEPGRRYRVEGRTALGGGTPKLLWGFYESGVTCVGGAGAAISHDAASELWDVIQTFRTANPCDPDSKRQLGAWHVRGWST